MTGSFKGQGILAKRRDPTKLEGGCVFCEFSLRRSQIKSGCAGESQSLNIFLNIIRCRWRVLAMRSDFFICEVGKIITTLQNFCEDERYYK